MQYAYEAEFEHLSDEGGDYWYVEFPQFDGAFADGATIAEACANAADVLTLFVAGCLDEGTPLPDPVFHEPPLSVVCRDMCSGYVL